jgi:putative Mg2+ transporter-C (MgtC) family protein
VDLPPWPFDAADLEIALRLVAALGIGGLIGLERSFHGRPAGFRTHALVCMSTALLMLVTVYEDRWFPASFEGRVVLDPTRMVQGIMTGIGFLGAGTIMKHGLSVRGLTTAASIWATAAIGVLVGIGFPFPALLATALTLGTLSVFRWVEARMPSQFYAQLTLRFAGTRPVPEARLRALLGGSGFTIKNLSCRLDRGLDFIEYRMTIRSSCEEDARRLTEALAGEPELSGFRIAPTGD